MKRASIAALGVLILTAVALLLLRGVQSGDVTIVAYTDDAGGLTSGTSVRLNGIAIGELEDVILTNSRDPQRKIRMVMKVNRRILHEIPEDSLVGEASTNLLGNYFINIIQGRSHQAVQPGGELKTTVGVDPNKLMGQMATELQQIDAIFARADKLIQGVQAGQGDVGMWQKYGLTKMDSVTREFDQLSASIRNGHGNLSKVNDLTAQLDAIGKRLNNLTSDYQSDQGASGRLKTLIEATSQMSTEVNQVTDDLNSPRGPNARLAKLQEGLDGLTASVQSTVNRINSGQGTLGQLTVNPQFSQALDHAGKEFQSLADEIRANPRKFLSFSVRLF